MVPGRLPTQAKRSGAEPNEQIPDPLHSAVSKLPFPKTTLPLHPECSTNISATHWISLRHHCNTTDSYLLQHCFTNLHKRQKMLLICVRLTLVAFVLIFPHACLRSGYQIGRRDTVCDLGSVLSVLTNSQSTALSNIQSTLFIFA